MKHTKTIKFFGMLAIVSGLIIFSSCGKDGATGPAGPAGATGATGPAGPNAKVVDFSLTYNVGDSLKSTTISGSSANDIGLCYYKFSDGSYLLLPYYSADGSGFYIIPYFNPTTGLMEVETVKRINTAATFNLRAVMIKGTAKNPAVDYTNYNSVKAYYHLKD